MLSLLKLLPFLNSVKPVISRKFCYNIKAIDDFIVFIGQLITNNWLLILKAGT